MPFGSVLYCSVSHRWVYDPGVVHAVRKDFVGEHKISKAKGDKRDYYPQHNIANNAGKVNAANKPAIFLTVRIDDICFADDKPK